MTWIQYAILKEAYRIRTEAGYRPEGWQITLEWANQIEEEERTGQRRRRIPAADPTPEKIRKKQIQKAGIRLRDAIRSAKNNGLTREADKLQEFYDANYR